MPSSIPGTVVLTLAATCKRRRAMAWHAGVLLLLLPLGAAACPRRCIVERPHERGSGRAAQQGIALTALQGHPMTSPGCLRYPAGGGQASGGYCRLALACGHAACRSITSAEAEGFERPSPPPSYQA